MKMITRLFTAALITALATFTAYAGEQRSERLIAFDEAVRLYVDSTCNVPPQGFGAFSQVNLTVEATADENGIVRTNYAGKRECHWYPADAENPPHMRPSEKPMVIRAAEDDKRPIQLIAFDRGVNVLLKTRCTIKERPVGLGRFDFVRLRLQATVQADGTLLTNQMKTGCGWHPLITGSLQQ